MNDVKALYTQLVRSGAPPKEAAKIAQDKTGLSVVTGKPIKRSQAENLMAARYPGRTTGKANVGQYR